MKFIPTILFCLLCISMVDQNCLEAGILVQEHLVTVDQVALRIMVPQSDPLPGTKEGTLKNDLEQQVAQVFADNDLIVNASSAQRFFITIRQERVSGVHNKRVLTLLYELDEPAKLEREWFNEREAKILVTTWRTLDVLIVTDENFHELLLEAITSSSKRFATKVLGAKNWKKRRGAGPPPVEQDDELESIQTPSEKSCEEFGSSVGFDLEIW